MDHTVHVILQARILEFPSPTDLPDSGIEPGSPALQADSLPAELPGKPILHPEARDIVLKYEGCNFISLNHLAWFWLDFESRCRLGHVSMCV